MSQRQTDPRFDPSSQDRAADPAGVDTECAPEAEAALKESLDPEHPDFDPFRFSRVSVSPELRRQLVQARLPRLDPNYLQDTLPPRGPEDPPPSDDSFLAPAQQPRRRGGVFVALCLLGAALLLLFAFPRSKLVAAPVAAAQNSVASASRRVAASQASAVVRAIALPMFLPGLPGSTQASAPPPAPAPAQTSLHQLAGDPIVSAPQARQAASVSAASATPTAPTAAGAAPAPAPAASAAPASAAPASATPKPSVVSPTPWFDYKK